MSDTSKDSDKKPSSPAEKKRLARSEVRNALRDQRAKLRELRQGMRSGQDLSDDIDSCSGEIELLMKELQSIEEGGHTTFLDAKKLIAPKKDVSSKKKNIKEQSTAYFRRQATWRTIDHHFRSGKFSRLCRSNSRTVVNGSNERTS